MINTHRESVPEAPIKESRKMKKKLKKKKISARRFFALTIVYYPPIRTG